MLALVYLLTLGLQTEAFKLHFLSDLADSVVVQHTGVSFHCHVGNDGASGIDVRWFVDSVEVTNSSEHRVFDNGTLYYPRIAVPGAVAASTFVYRCRASDMSGSIISREAKVQFAYLSAYLSVGRPNTKDINSNNTVYLECPTPYPTSIPPARVVWKKDGNVFNGGLDLGPYATTLQIPSANASLDGSYTCEFHNDMLQTSVVSPPVKLTIIAPTFRLHFLTQGNDVPTTSGGSVLLQCVATNVVPPSISWGKENGELPAGRAKFIGSNLKIENVESSDAGYYSCNAGALHVQYLKLIVEEIPVIKEFTPSSEHVLVVRSSFKIKCTAYGKPTTKIQWAFNGVAIDKSELLRRGINRTTTTETDASNLTVELEIKNVLKTHEGYYQCFASNIIGDVYKTMYLRVDVPPSLLDSPRQSVEILQDKPFTLECSMTGSPPPALTWTLDGQEIVSDSHRTITTNQLRDRTDSSLHVTQARHADSGQYVCHGKNTAGIAASSGTRVAVYVGAAITNISNINGNLHESVTLDITVIGLPRPTIRWYFHQQSNPITSGGRYKILERGALKISKVEFSDVGQYDVEVQNTVNNKEHKDRRHLILSVTPIVSRQGGTLMGIIGESVIINCSVKAQPVPSEIFWSKDEFGELVSHGERISFNVVRKEESYSLMSQLVINRLSEEDSGNYSCWVNKDGGNLLLDSVQLEIVIPATVSAVEKKGFPDAAIAVIVVVLVLVGVAVGIAVAIWVWKYRRDTTKLEKSMTSQVQLERVMRHSDQSSPSFYASSGPHPALDIDVGNVQTDETVHQDADRDVSFSSFRRRPGGGQAVDSPDRQRVQGRRAAGFARRSAGADSTDLPPYSERDPLRSTSAIQPRLSETGEPTATAISTDVDAFSDQKRFSYRSAGSANEQAAAESTNQESTDISTVV